MIEKGKHYEQRAIQFLEKHGLKLIEKNYRCKAGEIDAIMLDKKNDMLVFVECRYRKHKNFTNRYASALESVDYRKQQKLLRTARYFLHCAPFELKDKACRFDVIAIDENEHHASSPKKVEWIKNAFEDNA